MNSLVDRDSKKIDYGAIRLKVGLEVHQQLATQTKLFCACPPFSGEGAALPAGDDPEEFDRKYPVQIRRLLRPVTSELGEMDEAARFESRKEIKVKYVSTRQDSCLVEADEEPPHPINADAVETALIFALALNSRIVDEIHVMRKIVVDGSNTSGFQRTAVVALGGTLVYDSEGSSVPVQSISVEEDAARAVENVSGEQEVRDERIYALDRLGTPLVEVALAPIEGGTPNQVGRAASSLGRLLRSTGRIARGLGTIRQDLNISVMDGRVIEVKGVQKLEQLGRVVEFEAARQKFFFDLAKQIEAKMGRDLKVSSSDVSEIFTNSQSKILTSVFKNCSAPVVRAVIVRSFSGFFGRENEQHSRLGKELGSIARTYGIGGVFHSDELPNYGITEREVEKVRKRLEIAEIDAFVLVAGESPRVSKCVDAVMERIKQSSLGVPAETRAASPDGETTFLRPRPGAARMYPETDIPLLRVSKDRLKELESMIPERWEVAVEKFSKLYGLPSQLGEPLLDSERKSLFTQVVSSTKLSPAYVASVLLDLLQSISREGLPADMITDDTLKAIFSALDSGRFAKEGMPELVRLISREPELSLEEALAKSGIGSISKDELEEIIRNTLRENAALIKAKGRDSQSTIMGKVMQKVRGKADGKLVSASVNKAIEDFLKIRN